jgi:Ni,Fe-hydrogenase III small subunit
MLAFLRALLSQRRPTSPFPGATPPFPPRFRGRPSLVRLTGGSRALPVVDLGACLFSPEEATELDGAALEYTPEIAMSARARRSLVTDTGVVDFGDALDRRMRALLGRSLRLRSVVAGSCAGCEGELAALSNAVFDIARFGVQFVASPRHADGIVITGVVNRNMVGALERTYDALPDPRLVIAVGACPAGGGPFRGSPEIVGIPASIPVDLWIPGCPPHPLTILDGILRLLGRLGRDGGRG